jgi:poly(A) polymerase
VSPSEPSLLTLADEPVPRTLRAAAGSTACHLVGGLLRDRLLGIASGDFDAVVAANGLEIGERLAHDLPARLVHLGGKAFAAYRLVGDGFTLDIWDRRGQSLQADLARRDFTINAFALDLADRTVVDPFNGLGDLHRRRLRATTTGVFADDPLRVLRLVRLSTQLADFHIDHATLDLARESAAQLSGVAAERVRDELGRVLATSRFLQAFEHLVSLDLYPGLFQGRPGESGDPRRARALLHHLEPALEHLTDLPALPHAHIEPSAPRLAVLLTGLASEPQAAEEALEGYRRVGYLPGRAAGRCRHLLRCRAAPSSEAEERWFLHRWGEHWPAATATLAATAVPLPVKSDWRRLVERLITLARQRATEIFAPAPLLDGNEIGRLLGIHPGPELGRAVERLRRAQIEGRVLGRAEAAAWLRSSATGAD